MFASILFFGDLALYLVLLIITFLKDHKSNVFLAFLFLLISLLLWKITIFIYFFGELSGVHLLFIGRLNYVGAILIPPGLLYFFYYFPQVSFKIPSFLKNLSFFEIILVSILTLFTPLIDAAEIATPQGPQVVLGEGYLLFVIHLFGYIFLTLWLGFKKLFTIKGLNKTKFQYSFLIFVPFIAILSFLNGVLPIFDIFIFQEYSFLLIVPIILSSAYALQKYRFFQFSTFSINLLRKIVFGVIVITFALFLDSVLNLSFPEARVFILIFILLVSLFFYFLLEKFFPKITPQNVQLFREMIAQLCSKVLFFDDYHKLQNILEKIFVIKLNIAKAKLFLIREIKTDVEIPTYLKDDFTEYLSQQKTDLILKEEIPFKEIGSERQKIILNAFNKLEAELCLPLFSEGRIIGFFVLGQKENAESYIQEEIQELLKFRQNLEICFMNILLKKNLQEENDLMKNIIEEKTKQLQTQYAAIKKLLKQQSDFIAVTAHEFRTPLSVALFQLEDLLENYSPGTKEITDLKNIENSLQNLKELTENLFKVEQYDLDKVCLNLIDLNLPDFLEKFYADFKMIMFEKKIKFIFQNNCQNKLFCKIDPSYFKQVLHNLLNNASKFTPETGEIVLEINQEGNFVLVKIKDNGQGVSDENKKLIFEKFHTGKIGTQTGMGLGLYICKKIIDLHHGEIWAEDNLSEGAVFCIKLSINGDAQEVF